MHLYTVSLLPSEHDTTYVYCARSAREAAELYAQDAFGEKLSLDEADFEEESAYLRVHALPSPEGKAAGPVFWQDIECTSFPLQSLQAWAARQIEAGEIEGPAP